MNDELLKSSKKSTYTSNIAWQKRLLPVMIRMIVGLTLFFLIASLGQLFYLNYQIQNGPGISIENDIAELNITKAGYSETHILHEELRIKALLEIYIVKNRYYQGSILLMARMWIRYLGFVAGIILAMVGSIFVLGKLQESSSKLETKTDAIQLSFTSASPGIIMAVLGTILIIATIVTHHEIEITDVATYLSTNQIDTVSTKTKEPVKLNNPYINQKNKLLEDSK